VTFPPTEEDLPCGLRGGYPLRHDQRTHGVGQMLGADEFEKQGHIDGGSVPFLPGGFKDFLFSSLFGEDFQFD